MHQVKVRHLDQNFHQPPAALLTTKTCSDCSDEGSDDNENQEKKELKNSRQHTFLQTYTKEREKAEEKKLSFLGEMKDEKSNILANFSRHKKTSDEEI